MKYIANYSEGILGQADPIEVWKSVIDSIPDSILTKKNCRIMNFACGHGTEADIIVKRMSDLDCSQKKIKESIYVNDKGIEFTNRMKRKGYINVSTVDFLNWDPNMNFDVTLSNPPYNSFVGDNRTEAKNTNNSNLYFDFISKAISVTPNGVIVMIVPAAWMQNDTVRQLVLDAGLESIDWVDPSHFPGVGIRSGISLFKATKGYTGDITIRKGLNVYTVPRNGTLSFDDPTKFNIVDKVKVGATLDSKLKYGPYKIPKGSKGSLTRLTKADPSFNDKQTSKHKIKVMIYAGGGRDPARYLWHKLNQTDTRYGLAIPSASDKYILGAARIILPGEGVSDRLKVVYFDKQKQAKNCLQYLNSKLVRFIIATTKHNDTVNTNKNSFGNIPLVDFNQSMTDQMIYANFNLTQKEIDYIESQFN